MHWPTIAFGFLAGDIGHLAERALAVEGVQSHFLRIPGETRLNVTVVDETTRSGTSFYDRGPEVSAADLENLNRQLSQWLHAAQVLVLAGSLPPGLPDDTYAAHVRFAEC